MTTIKATIRGESYSDVEKHMKAYLRNYPQKVFNTKQTGDIKKDGNKYVVDISRLKDPIPSEDDGGKGESDKKTKKMNNIIKTLGRLSGKELDDVWDMIRDDL